MQQTLKHSKSFAPSRVAVRPLAMAAQRPVQRDQQQQRPSAAQQIASAMGAAILSAGLMLSTPVMPAQAAAPQVSRKARRARVSIRCDSTTYAQPSTSHWPAQPFACTCTPPGTYSMQYPPEHNHMHKQGGSSYGSSTFEGTPCLMLATVCLGVSYPDGIDTIRS